MLEFSEKNYAGDAGLIYPGEKSLARLAISKS
jgi:hypothetical protein